MSTTARIFQAKDYVLMLEYKERVCGIVTRETHATMGVIYIVRTIPLSRKED